MRPTGRISCVSRSVLTSSTAPSVSPVIHRNNVTVLGLETSATVIFAHGYGTDHSTWRGIAEKFSDTHRVVLFDYVGSGQSDLSAYDANRYDSLEGYATDLIDVIEAVDARSVFVIAHAASGMIAALAAIRRPELIRRILMVNTSPRYVNDVDYIGGFTFEDVQGLISGIEANQPGLTAQTSQPEASSRAPRFSRATSEQVAKHFARVVFLSDTRHRLAEVPVPCVVLQASDDVMCPAHLGRYLSERIPQCELIKLESAGHFVHLAEPELISSYIRAQL
jgi:sigma-B regulation protein RsbQ